MITVKDCSFLPSQFIAYTKTVIDTREGVYYCLCIYLKGVDQPIVITYETEEERNDDAQCIRNYYEPIKASCCE